MKTAWTVAFVLSLAFNAAFVAAWTAQSLSARAGGAPEGPCGGPGSVGCPLYRQLGVTPEQWRKIEPGLKAFQERCREECLGIDRSKEALIDLVAAPGPDLEAIRAKQKEILAGHEKMQASLVDHLLEGKMVLSGEQQKRLFEMMRGRGCGCHGRGKGGGCGGGRDCPGCGRQR